MLLLFMCICSFSYSGFPDKNAWVCPVFFLYSLLPKPLSMTAMRNATNIATIHIIAVLTTLITVALITVHLKTLASDHLMVIQHPGKHGRLVHVTVSGVVKSSHSMNRTQQTGLNQVILKKVWPLCGMI